MDREKFDLEQFPTSGSAKRMLSYVTPGFYDNSYVGKWLYQVMGLEYDDAKKLAEELQYQMFPETATWGLMYHEQKWQLPVRKNLSYEERRRRIYEKRDYRAPMTPYHMEKYLRNVMGVEVRIVDINDVGDYGFIAPHPNVFKAYFIGNETLDSVFVHKILDRLKQSHTTYIVNDRMESVVDNRNLEQFLLRSVYFKMAIPFWDCYFLDGSWLLDGSIYLNSSRYKGKAKLRLKMGVDSSSIETIDNMMIVTRRNLWYLDGSVKLDSSRLLNAAYGEEIIE